LKSLFILVVISLLLFPLLSACGSSRGTIIPSGVLPASTAEAADDIVYTPGGGVAYRANAYEGDDNPWTLIPVAVTYWTQGKDTLSVLYRSEIESKAEESHTYIILVGDEDEYSISTPELKLYAQDMPEGIEIVDSHTATGRATVSGTVLVVTVSPGIAPGKYSIKIGVELDGKYYGTIPCTIMVIE